MTRKLILKELRQHWWAFLALAVVCGFGLLSLLGQLMVVDQSGSRFEILPRFAIVVAIAAAILCNRLVVAEYGARTQLFLEALPLPRIRIVLVKFFLGLAVIAAIAGTAFALTLLSGMRTEVFTPQFLQILAARFGAACLCYYCFFFMTGFLGRYRLGFFIIVVFSAFFIEEMRDFELNRFGPFKLLDATFAFEREVMPWEPLFVTVGIAAGCIATALAFATIREGSVASLLGERMSHREKVGVTVLIISLFFAVSVLEERKEKQSYDLLESAVEFREGISVKVSPKSPAARQFASSLAEDLSELRDYLALERIPPVFIILRKDLDPQLHEKGKLQNADVVVMRTNFTHSDWKRDHFAAFALEQLLHARSEGRTEKEDRAWIVDGFTLFWTRRAEPAEESHDPALALRLRALYATDNRPPLSGDTLKNWFRLRDRFGREIAAGLAWSGLRVLDAKSRPNGCRDFLRSVLAADTPKDFRTTFGDLVTPLSKRFETHTGLAMKEFLGLWNGELDEWRATQAAAVASTARLRGDLSFEPLSADSFLANYRLAGGAEVAKLEKAFLVYSTLEPFQVEVSEELHRRVRIDVSDPERSSGTLPEDYPRGTRLYYTFAAFDERLGCRLISGWKRKEVR